MFETRLQTYWSDADAAGIVYFPNFFRFVAHAEEELFRAAGHPLQPLMSSLRVWLPRVEAFSRFSKPIAVGEAIRIRLKPQLKGEKTIRYDYEIFDDSGREKLAEGYVTVVCVDMEFKSTALPPMIRNIIENVQSE